MNRFSIVVATLAFSGLAFAQADVVQQGYMSNLNAGDSYLNITNAGLSGAALGFGPAGVDGNLCANIYVFDPAQEMIACCSCLTTPDGLYSLSAKNDLAVKPLTNLVPNSIVIKITATIPGSVAFNVCDPRTPAGVQPSSPGLRAWATTLHAGPAGTFVMTENALAQGNGGVILGTTEFTELPIECSFTMALGSGSGICNSCKNQGLASAKQ
jgi:hypothetical protein